jgi:hypothetical protein
MHQCCVLQDVEHMLIGTWHVLFVRGGEGQVRSI